MMPLQLLQCNGLATSTSWWEPELYFITWALSTGHALLQGAKFTSDIQCGAAPWSGQPLSLKLALFTLYFVMDRTLDKWPLFFGCCHCGVSTGVGCRGAVGSCLVSSLRTHCAWRGKTVLTPPAHLPHLLLVSPYCRGLKEKKISCFEFSF